VKLDGTVVLTGGSGFIGGALATRLLAAGTDVHCLIRPGSVGTTRRRGIPEERIVEVSEFTCAQLAPIMETLRPTYVFHLAASGVLPGSVPEDEILEANLGLVTQLLLGLRACSIQRFIHTGSCFEYALDLSADRLTEESPIAPQSIYGAAKAASVLCGNALARQLGIPFITLRLFGVFGPGEDSKRLVPYLLDSLISERRVDLTPGEQIRDFLFIHDVLDAYVSAAISPSLSNFSTYNICSGCPTRIKDLAIEVARVLNRPMHLLAFGERPYRSDECMRMLGDNSRFRCDTDWQPRTSLEAGISLTISAEMAHRGISDWSAR